MDYPLKDFARFLEYDDVEGTIKYGLRIRCPNCGREYLALFIKPIGASESRWPDSECPHWQRTGDALETMSLSPSFLAYGCYHSWIKSGQLCIDSPFSCKAEKK